MILLEKYSEKYEQIFNSNVSDVKYKKNIYESIHQSRLVK